MALFQGQSLKEWRREEQRVIMLFFFSKSGVFLRRLPLKCSPESKGVAPNTVSGIQNTQIWVSHYREIPEHVRFQLFTAIGFKQLPKYNSNYIFNYNFVHHRSLNTNPSQSTFNKMKTS